MSALDDLRTATEQLRATMALVVEMIVEIEDADTAVEILRGVHIAEKCVADALRELQTPEDPRPVEPLKAPEEPAQSEDDPADGHLVLSPSDVRELVTMLDGALTDIVDSWSMRRSKPDGECLLSALSDIRTARDVVSPRTGAMAGRAQR